MAIGDCKRLNCRDCGASFSFLSKSGRPHVLCGSCRTVKSAPKPHATHCAHCGELISQPRGGKKYCSVRCSLRARDWTRLTRQEYREQRRAAAMQHPTNAFVCEFCGKDAYRKMSSTNAQNGYENRYCSMECRTAHADAIRTEREALVRIGRAWRPRPVRERCVVAVAKELCATLRRIARKREHAARPCQICGSPVGYAHMGAPRKYCSSRCERKSESAIASRRLQRAKRKALKRGANGAEAVNPLAVFAAAGWRCQICNRPTPQRLRGTTHKRAPELDHIVPVSKGGKHTWANTQCACRECNLWKSDRIVVGQAGLFSGLT